MECIFIDPEFISIDNEINIEINNAIDEINKDNEKKIETIPITPISDNTIHKPLHINPIQDLAAFYHPSPGDPKPCPWCQRYCDKDDACNHVVCGVESGNPNFQMDKGCGRQFCFHCGKKLCGQVYNEQGHPTGVSQSHGPGQHHPTVEDPCDGPDYCPGGHNSHK